MKKLFALFAIALSPFAMAEPNVFSTVKGPVVLGHLSGKTESAYIPFSKTDGDPVIATEKFAMPRTGAAIANPFTLVGMQGGNKLWLAKYISGTGHKDAPTDLTTDSQYILVGGREYGSNSYRGIGYGYVSSTTDIAPVFTGILERNTGSNTYGDFIIATRGSTSNVAPDVRLTVTYDGRILAAPGYEPKDDEALTNKNYVDDLIADLQKQIDDLKKEMKITPDVIAAFRKAFNGTFSDSSVWSDDILIEALCEANAETGGSGWGGYVDECSNFKQRGMFYYAAHYLAFIYADDPSAPISGIARLNTQSKTVGDESISYRVASMMDAGDDALTYTVFGQQFYRMRRRAAMGARAV